LAPEDDEEKKMGKKLNGMMEVLVGACLPVFHVRVRVLDIHASPRGTENSQAQAHNSNTHSIVVSASQKREKFLFPHFGSRNDFRGRQQK
jgi:hypothetical protein